MYDDMLDGATIFVNDNAIPYVSASLKFNYGRGEQKVNAQVLGPNQVRSTYSNDLTTNIGKVMFSCYSTTGNISTFDFVKQNANRNRVKIVNEPKGFVKTWNNMAMTNNWEVGVSPEGTFEIELMGSTVI